jgi:hypothetical protein
VKTVLGIILGVAVGVIGLGLVLELVIRNPISSALRPPANTVDVNLNQTQLVKKYIYAEKDFAIRVPGKEPRFFGLLEAERLYLNTGRCSAGIDYTKAAFQVVERNERSIFIRIPPPEIFPCTFIEAGQLWDGSGFVVASTDLSNRLARIAFEELQTQAPRSDLLDRAKTEALDQAELDMFRVGFEKVRVEFPPASEQRP